MHVAASGILGSKQTLTTNTKPCERGNRSENQRQHPPTPVQPIFWATQANTIPKTTPAEISVGFAIQPWLNLPITLAIKALRAAAWVSGAVLLTHRPLWPRACNRLQSDKQAARRQS